jgi:hypothetical protein
MKSVRDLRSMAEDINAKLDLLLKHQGIVPTPSGNDLDSAVGRLSAGGWSRTARREFRQELRSGKLKF